MKIQYIYALICPKDSQIKYIGKTVDPITRLRAHIAFAMRNNQLKGKHEWIRLLNQEELKPLMIVLEKCNDDDWIEREKYWISFYSKSLTLFNKTIGGEDFVFKSGNTPWNKGGADYSDETRLKMRLGKLGKPQSESQKLQSSLSALGKKKSPEHVYNIRIARSKHVEQYSLDNILLNEFKSALFAAETIFDDTAKVSSLQRNIRNACVTNLPYKGFIWKFKN